LQTRFDFIKEDNEYTKHISLNNITGKIIEENIGKELASFLRVVIKSFKPKRILELGTGIGYATSVIINASKEYKREFVSIDIDEKKLAQTKKKLANFNFSNVKFYCKDASEFLSENSKRYNLILLDLNPFLYIELFSSLVLFQKSGDILLIHDAIIPQIDIAPKELKEAMKEFNSFIINQDYYKIHKISLNDGFWYCIRN